MAQITAPFMRSLYDGVSLKFNEFLDAAPSQWREVAMEVPSSSRANFYPKLDEIPGLREWIGARVVHELSVTSYAIPNKTYEETLGIDREDIEDDQLGLFNIAMAQLGKNAAEFPDQLVYGLLKAGASTLCYDGQYFFDTDHVNTNAAGQQVQYSNLDVPATNPGDPWFLIDNSRPLKSLIFQPRRPAVLTAKTALTDDNVFENKRFLWGIDLRCGVGFGLWQTAYMSRQPLTKDNYAKARAAMGSLRRVDGAPLGITPTTLLVPPSLEGKALALANNEFVSTQNPDNTFTTATNEWKGTVRAVKVPWLG